MINLPKLVKSGKTLLCVGDETNVGEYPLGRGYVYCRSFQEMEPLPEKVDILVLIHEPIGEIREKLVAIADEVHDAWKEDE